MKYNQTSPNTSFMDQQIHFTDSAKILKFLSNDHSQSIWTSQKFYLRYYLLLTLAFSNNILHFGFSPNDWNLLLISVGFLLFLIVFSLLTILCAENENLGNIKLIFQYPVLLALTGICLVLMDPHVMSIITGEPYDSYISSMQTMILLSALGYNYSEYSVKFPFFIGALAVSALVLETFSRVDLGQLIYEFALLIAFVLSGAIYLRSSRSFRIDKAPPEAKVFSGVEEITNNIDAVLDKLIDFHENPEKFQNLQEIISSLKKINSGIRNTPNIYSVKINSITRNMDEQDKLFIEQACFESYTLSNGASPKLLQLNQMFEVNYGVTELTGVLKGIGTDWNFNTFFITDCSGGTPLEVIGMYAIKRFGLDETFSMAEPVLARFFKELEGKYEENPYHNSTHAADVMCSMVYLIQNSLIVDHTTPLELLASILAALAHDIGHPAKNNRFLVMTGNDIAILYNDISVLEMMHTAKLFQILKNKELNILSGFSTEKWTLTRKDIIDMILATDMGKHFELLGQFKVKYLSTDLHDLTSADVRLDLFKLMIKASDIGHAAKSVELHEVWCGLVIQEFYEQGDLEKSLGLPISMYCDRENTDVSKSQIGFIKNIVYPLFSSLNVVLSSQKIEEKCVQQLLTNQAFWESQHKGHRGQSLIIKDKSSFLPRIKSRKCSLPPTH